MAGMLMLYTLYR